MAGKHDKQQLGHLRDFLGKGPLQLREEKYREIKMIPARSSSGHTKVAVRERRSELRPKRDRRVERIADESGSVESCFF